MGLIKAAKSAISGTLHDQWKDAIRCENMENDILMIKKTTDTGVITNGSIIVVEPGQCAVIIDNGKVIDATAEDGTFKFDTSSSPSFFSGQFGATFKEMWNRFTYNGATSKEQSVYFFNIKEIFDNKFGTPTPIPYADWSHPIPNQMTNTVTPLRVEIKCFGKYTFKISDPAMFMNKIAGSASIYKKDELTEQIRSEVIAVFQNITNELGTEKYKVPVLELPSQTDEIKEMMDDRIFDEKIRERGIEIVCFAVESVTLTDASNKKIDDYELSSNSYMQQGRLVESYANAVEKAAANSNGAANGFMGIGIMNMASGGIVGGAANGPWNANNQGQPANTPASNAPVGKAPETPSEPTWKCGCGNENQANVKFCPECGKPKATSKKCPKCGAENSLESKFCAECGEKL